MSEESSGAALASRERPTLKYRQIPLTAAPGAAIVSDEPPRTASRGRRRRRGDGGYAETADTTESTKTAEMAEMAKVTETVGTPQRRKSTGEETRMETAVTA